MKEKLRTVFVTIAVAVLVILACLLQYKDVNAAEPREQTARSIFYQLQHQLPREYWNIKLAFYDKQNAEAGPGIIYFGRPFLRYPNDVIALVLGHELGHEVLGHMVISKDTYHEEQDADSFGLMLATSIGYEPHQMLKDAKQLFMSFKGNKTHGQPKDRLDRMNNQQTYLDTYSSRILLTVFLLSLFLRGLLV